MSDEQPQPAPQPSLAGDSRFDAAAAGGGDHPGDAQEPARASPPSAADRLMALVEVLLCSGFPTQLSISVALAALGFEPLDARGRLSPTWVFALSLVDAVVVVSLVLWFLRLHGERPDAVLLGQRPVLREALLGLPLMLVAFALVVVILTLVQQLVPSLHNVTRNPMQDLIRSARDAWLFGIVGILSGGLREEVQRAFVLRRFEQYLGGPWVGLVLFSVAFGAGHVIQGWDVAVATASLGVLWGLVYVRRRSIAATVVSHAGFNAAEVFRYTFFGLSG